MAQATEGSATRAAIWSAVDRFGIVAMQFIINLLLARLLTPEDFGLVGMILIIVAVSTILADGGFGSALIQRGNASEEDYATSFYANISLSIALYTAIYLSAPLVARELGYAVLTDLLRAIGTVIILNSIGLVARVKLRISLRFKQIAISNISAYTISAIIAILLSTRGYGAWSLVVMHIANALISNILIIIWARWRPSARFSFQSLRRLAAYGEYMLITEIMSNVCFHIQGTLVGKHFTAYTAGEYAQAKKMEEVASITLPSALNQVVFPIYSRLKSDNEALRTMLRSNTRLVAFAVFPLLTILIIIAEPLILFLFGERWAESIPYFQTLCLGGYLGAMQYLNYQAVAATGRSRVLFITGIIKSAFTIIVLLIAVKISIEAVLVAMVVSNIVNYLVNAITAHIYIKYSLPTQLGDIAPTLLLATTLGFVAHIIAPVWNINWILLAVIYSALYLALSIATRSKPTEEIMRRLGIRRSPIAKL